MRNDADAGSGATRWTARERWRRVVQIPRKPLPTRVAGTPDLPPAYADALDRGLDELGLRLDAGARAAIDGQARLLLAWTESINLTAIRQPAAIALGHIVDSLSGLEVLRDRRIDRFVDLGSGAGYPGLPIAVALPAVRALLVEPIGKRAGFIKAVIEATHLEGIAEVGAVRGESLAGDARHRGRWPAVTARAVASLADLVELAFPLLAPGGILVAWKRGDLTTELTAAEHAVAALGGGRLDVVPVRVSGLETHRLVVATAHGRAPAGYPREPAARKRRPW